jgi:glutathione peroxidase
MQTLSQFRATAIDGRHISLADYSGKVVLVVNTASRCGMTPQYDGLEALYKTYADQGLVILGFPCDQFGHQEPGTEAEISDFCRLNFGVTFPMFAKVDVNGAGAHPLFDWLRVESSGPLDNEIEWNFTKFLVGRDGKVSRRYASEIEPAEIVRDLEQALAA